MLELELLYVTHCNIIPSARHINATSLNAFVSSLHTCSIFSGRISVGASHISQDVSDCIAISPWPPLELTDHGCTMLKTWRPHCPGSFPIHMDSHCMWKMKKNMLSRIYLSVCVWQVLDVSFMGKQTMSLSCSHSCQLTCQQACAAKLWPLPLPSVQVVPWIQLTGLLWQFWYWTRRVVANML